MEDCKPCGFGYTSTAGAVSFKECRAVAQPCPIGQRAPEDAASSAECACYPGFGGMCCLCWPILANINVRVPCVLLVPLKGAAWWPSSKHPVRTDCRLTVPYAGTCSASQ